LEGTPIEKPAGSAAETLGRRKFLARVSAWGATITAAVVAIPVIRALFSPALAPPQTAEWIKVADDIALLDVGVPMALNFVRTEEDGWVERRQANTVWVYSDDGEKFIAYNGHCTHLGCHYTFDKDLKTFACPCHRGQFDVKTGAVLAGPPPRPLDKLVCEVRDSALFVKYQDFRLGSSEQVAL
jgi:Rieske Fe-S protein